jgi:hypothetical protein
MKLYRKPFSVKERRIVDADGKEVRLWGVNYYAPFNHNYVNIKEMGVDPYKSIDRDIRDFHLMGFDLIRMHVYEREISDLDGNIIENDQMEIFDYLMMRLEEEDIYVMMTPMVWFNTVVNQQLIRDEYVSWYQGSGTAFGFTNKYTHHEMSWNEDALADQERFLHQFFSRKNKLNGKTLADMDNIVILEPVNEPVYPTPDLINKLRVEAGTAVNPYKKQECRLVNLYDKWLADKNKNDTNDAAREFCAETIDNYIRRLFAPVEKYFGSTVIKAHIWYGFTDQFIFDVLDKAPFDALSITVYAPCYFDSAHNDALNPLEELRRQMEYYKPLQKMNKAMVSYEFDTPATLLGRGYGGLAYVMAALGIQAAAMFTYTPRDVAAYNPGWVVHYLNLYHTPNKAAALAAGGEIFRKTPAGAALPESNDHWEAGYFETDVPGDRVIYRDKNTYIHSCPVKEGLGPEGTPSFVAGVGDCAYVSHDSNSCYFLILKEEKIISLTVLPHQWFVNDPFRGKAFKSMANRYVDTNREWIVSRLRERGSDFTLKYPGFERFKAERPEDGVWKEVPVKNGVFQADPDEYRITRL